MNARFLNTYCSEFLQAFNPFCCFLACGSASLCAACKQRVARSACTAASLVLPLLVPSLRRWRQGCAYAFACIAVTLSNVLRGLFERSMSRRALLGLLALVLVSYKPLAIIAGTFFGCVTRWGYLKRQLDRKVEVSAT